jgi:hypothetical protein
MPDYKTVVCPAFGNFPPVNGSFKPALPKLGESTASLWTSTCNGPLCAVGSHSSDGDDAWKLKKDAPPKNPIDIWVQFVWAYSFFSGSDWVGSFE